MSLTLREWRRVKEISQRTMADKIGVHVNTYMKMEKKPNKIAIEDAVKISDILAVPMDQINFNCP